MRETSEDDYIQELLKRLQRTDEREQWRAVQALARLRARAVPALLEALGGEDWLLRRHAASVFAEAPDARAIPLLCAALGDWDWEVRRESARALQVLGPPEAAEPLLPLLFNADEHPKVRLAVIKALTAIAARDAQEAVPRSVWARVIPGLCAALGAADWRLNGAAAGLLGTLRAESALDPLWAALGHADLEAALRITVALGQIGGPRSIEPLRVALSHREPDVRASAARALGRVGGEEAIMLLAWALRSRDPFLRRGAARAVERLARERPSPALRAVLDPLRRLAAPVSWATSNQDRLLYHRALGEVERATTHVRDLPLPSRAHSPAAHLPVPADTLAEPSQDPREPETRNPSPDSRSRLHEWLVRLRARAKRRAAAPSE
jgi:HEAT repeat protein